jgi:flagellar biosynthetic protein FliQ
MNEADVVQLGVQALTVAAKLAAPILIVSLVVGIIVSLLQTVFQVQDQTLAMVPKLVLGGVVLLIAGGWMLHTLVDYTTVLFNSIPSLVG